MWKGDKKKPVKWPRFRSGKTHGHVQGTTNSLVIELRQSLNIGEPQILLQMRQQAEKGSPTETHPLTSTETWAGPKVVLQYRWEVSISASILIYIEERSLEWQIQSASVNVPHKMWNIWSWLVLNGLMEEERCCNGQKSGLSKLWWTARMTWRELQGGYLAKAGLPSSGVQKILIY